MSQEDPRNQFAALVAAPDDEIELARAALLIAQEEYAYLEPERYLVRLDDLAAGARERLAGQDEPYALVNRLSEYLFDEEGLQGNQADYYDPANSFLNEVLERRLGIPITLSVIYLEVGWRLGLPLRGVGLPGHFVVKYQAPEEEIVVDPFNRGIILSEAECRRLVAEATGGSISFQRGQLAAVSKRQILARMLANLKLIYLNRRRYERALATVEYLLLVTAKPATELRDRGLIYLALGHLTPALADLEAYLMMAPNAADADTTRHSVDVLRRRLAQSG